MSMCLSGPLNIWKQQTYEISYIFVYPWGEGGSDKSFFSPYLNLLDVILDPLDRVAINIIPSCDLFSSYHLCSDYCSRKKKKTND